jgi:hypothetical protein
LPGNLCSLSVQRLHDIVDKEPCDEDEQYANEGVGKYLMRACDVARIRGRHDVEYACVKKQECRDEHTDEYEPIEYIHGEYLRIADTALSGVADTVTRGTITVTVLNNHIIPAGDDVCS